MTGLGMPVGSHVSFYNFQNRTCWGLHSDEKYSLCECVTNVSGVEKSFMGRGFTLEEGKKKYRDKAIYQTTLNIFVTPTLIP